MTRRRPPRPSPGKDWRAIAEPRPQRRLPLPVVDDRAGPDALADVELRVRRGPDGGRYVLLRARVSLTDPAVVRALADRLTAAARSLEAHARDGPAAAAPSAPAPPPT